MPKDQQSTHQVDIWYTVCPVPAGYSIGLGRGDFAAAFADRPVKLNNIRTHADRAVRETNYNHSQRNGFREGGNVPLMWARSEGEDVRVLGILPVERVDQIAVGPNSDIRDLAGLAGRRIGIATRPNDKIDYVKADDLGAFHQALRSIGAALSEVEIVEVPITEPLASSLSGSSFDVAKQLRAKGQKFRALLAGEVDAIHISAWDIEAHWLLGTRTLFDLRESLPASDRVQGSNPMVLTVRGELLRDHPDLVDDYVAQVIRTARWAKANPGEARRRIGRDTGMPEETVPLAFNPQIAETLEASLAPDLIERLSRQKDLLLRFGIISNDFEVADWVAHGPLDRARAIVEAEATG
ncbi:ABC transporter substrate-binding protein [Rhodobacter sp. 24-YEA-8]|uniref:ABC transporter substrate-binding protein n=1 Tax=Rhodobacter sp. 24-YEA-8 TaxID=1884310 RepID=UPI00089881CC|nr:ABC transporter substrate-binding protein [Rhodobacter sp. 24-YEA-8]SED88192.1 ABC-type nitrate/sulfonate/bicarbonate transport system, substrate-binding protein [Rhodobacter sp. 24-YEA-8]